MAKIRKTNELFQYRGYTLNKDMSEGEAVLYVEAPDGPFDVENMRQARMYIDLMIEEIVDGPPPCKNESPYVLPDGSCIRCGADQGMACRKPAERVNT